MSGTRTSLDPRVAAAFYGGFKELHPVQTAAVEPLAGGRNVVLSSGTGSGKTEAVVAPLLGRFWTDALRDERTVMLYIAPTKALINDIAKRLDGPLSQLGLRVGIRHGDRNDLRLASKPHVLVTTPESLNVMLRQKETVLAGIRCVVVDEIHLLFNTQRGLHLAILLWRLRRITGQPPQWAALSATIGNLPAVCSFFFGPSESADFLQFPATRTIEAQIRIIHSPTELRKLFVKLMDAPRRKLLVFANSRKKCETLAGELQRAGVLAPFVFTHYSSLSPELRERTERDFTEAPRAICIATSTLEIGIDIGDIDAVVLVGVPPDIASFLQRIGRGNRRSSKTNVIALCEEGPAADRETALFANLLNLGRAGRMPVSGPQRLWGAVVQQFLSLIQQEDGAYTPVADLVAEAGALPHLTRAAADEILAELAAVGILQKHGFKNRYGAGDGLWQMEENKMLFGNFPLASQNIDLRACNQILGSVPRFNLLKLKLGTRVRFAGRMWCVKRIDPAFVEVEAAIGKQTGVELAYGGAGDDGLDSFHAHALREVIFGMDQAACCMSDDTWTRIGPKLSRVRELANTSSMACERLEDGYRYYTFAGTLANRVIASWFGNGAVAESDLTLTSPVPLPWASLPTDPAALLAQADEVFSPSERQTVFQQRLPVSYQRDEWIQEWLGNPSVVEVLGLLQRAEILEIPSGLLNFLIQQSHQAVKKSHP